MRYHDEADWIEDDDIPEGMSREEVIRLLDAIDRAWVVSPEAQARGRRLFQEKFRAAYPDHPWVKMWEQEE